MVTHLSPAIGLLALPNCSIFPFSIFPYRYLGYGFVLLSPSFKRVYKAVFILLLFMDFLGWLFLLELLGKENFITIPFLSCVFSFGYGDFTMYFSTLNQLLEFVRK